MIKVILFILTLHPLCSTLPRKAEPVTASSASLWLLLAVNPEETGRPEGRGKREAGHSSLLCCCVSSTALRKGSSFCDTAPSPVPSATGVARWSSLFP